MTKDEVMAKLAKLGSEKSKVLLSKHGAREPFFGVKIADLKVLQKQIKTDHSLALELYDTGNTDAMYFAGMIADPAVMTKAQLKKWVRAAYWHMLSGYTVAWVAAESAFGQELAKEWIEAKAEQVANAGWSTYSSLLAIEPDEDLDLDEIEKLMDRVKKEIGAAANRVKYAMNNFVISVGGYVAPLTKKAKAVANAIGTVEVDMGDTECEVPNALEKIEKIEQMGRVGRKRKRAMC
jgi:3-methyladenine DNA glycosylase AlkD